MNQGIIQKAISILSLILMLSGCLLTQDSVTLACGSTFDSARATIDFILLSSYKKVMKIGESTAIIAISGSGKNISWKSSNSKVASVDMYGIVTAKKGGSCTITAKTKGAESKCCVTVEKTKITLNTAKLSIENGKRFAMQAKTSSGATVTWKSSRQSVAIISDEGVIQALKPGTSVITATADGSKATCTLTVVKPTVTLSRESVRLCPGQRHKLIATVSSEREVTWKSSRSSVASVDENGKITAVKPGTARISARVDGVVRYCQVTVVKTAS